MSMDSTSSTLTLLDIEKVEKTPLPPPLEGLQPHSEFWIEDGNLILVARDVAFRVYRGLLAEQSTVLGEIAAESSEDVDEAIFDGCPIVRLSDSPQDLTHLLRILLPKSHRRQVHQSLHPKDEQEHTCVELSALVRLSHKYQIQDVKEQALDLLRECCPDNFDKYLELRPRSRPTCRSAPDTYSIAIVNIARLTDTPSLLPLALYLCCQLGARLLDGWKREDGCVEHISTDDLKRCFAARERLCEEGADIMCAIFNGQVSKCCSTSVGCRAASKKIVMSLMEDKLSRVIGCAALAGWVNIIQTRAELYHACAACEKELQLREVQARRELWNKLPEIFGISVPGWGKKVRFDSDISA